jgi:hypothetical protein
MADLGWSRKTRSGRGALTFLAALLGVGFAILVLSVLARQIFLHREPDVAPIIAGGDLDRIPALMRGNVKSATTSLARNEPLKPAPLRLCELSDTRRNEFIRSFSARRGFLDDRDTRIAKAAWHYFELYTQENTGLVNAVGNYPSTTMWDTASYISGLVSAYELCLIEKSEFDRRIMLLLTTLKGLSLFRGELPNKVYHTKTAEKVDYTNKPGEIGYSALDIGRLLVWLRIVKNRYAYLGNSVDSILLKWDFRNVIDSEGLLHGARIDEETDETIYAQEGRLGYEEYAAKGFALWGFHTILAHRAEPYLTAEIYGVAVPYDGRDPRIFHSQNYVVTESYLLDGLELGFDLPHDDSSPEWLHSDGWRAEFADRIYRVQEERWRQTGFMTARSEHNVKGAPYFTYDTIFSDGYAWNTVTPRGDYVPDHAAVSSKAAIGLWSLWDTEYTDVLYEAIADLYDPEVAMYEGLYERGQGRVEIFTANNNGIILAALLHKVQGTLLTPYTGETEVWYTAFRDQNIRQQRKYPDPPGEADWLPALRHSRQSEENFQ